MKRILEILRVLFLGKGKDPLVLLARKHKRYLDSADRCLQKGEEHEYDIYLRKAHSIKLQADNLFFQKLQDLN